MANAEYDKNLNSNNSQNSLYLPRTAKNWFNKLHNPIKTENIETIKARNIHIDFNGINRDSITTK
jgi:hypothetical protein